MECSSSYLGHLSLSSSRWREWIPDSIWCNKLSIVVIDHFPLMLLPIFWLNFMLVTCLWYCCPIFLFSWSQLLTICWLHAFTICCFNLYCLGFHPTLLLVSHCCSSRLVVLILAKIALFGLYLLVQKNPFSWQSSFGKDTPMSLNSFTELKYLILNWSRYLVFNLQSLVQIALSLGSSILVQIVLIFGPRLVPDIYSHFL